MINLTRSIRIPAPSTVLFVLCVAVFAAFGFYVAVCRRMGGAH